MRPTSCCVWPISAEAFSRSSSTSAISQPVCRWRCSGIRSFLVSTSPRTFCRLGRMASIGLSSATGPETPSASEAGRRPVVVGIISYNDADTVGDVVRRVSAGIAAHAPQGCLVLADGGSTDGTVKRAESAAADVCPLVTVDYSRPALDPLAAPYHGW